MPSKQKIIPCLFLLTFAVAILAPLGFLYAADPPPQPTYVRLAPLTGLTPPAEIAGEGLTGYLQTLFWLAIVSAGVLAVLMITMGGILYMTSEAFHTKEEAKKQITGAIVGFLLAISAVLILTTINSDLLTFKILTKPLAGFRVPETTSLTQGTIAGCTNFASQPITQCLWTDDRNGLYPRATFNVEACSSAFDNNYIDLTDGKCAEVKPPNDTSNSPPTCCGYIPPQGGCSGKGVRAGFTVNCRRAPSCEAPSFEIKSEYCDGSSSGKCCAAPI